MAIEVSVDGADVVVRLSGKDMVLAVRRSVRFPLAAVQSVAAEPRDEIKPRTWRLYGTWVPGRIRAGKFVGPGGPQFWCAYRGDPLLVIRFVPGSRYSLVALEVDDPVADAETIGTAIGGVLV